MRQQSAALLGAYVLLASTRWVLESVWPPTFPAEEASVLASLGLCAALPFFPSAKPTCRGADGWRVALPGILVFACFWALSGLVGRGLPGFTRTLLVTLVPVGIILITAARDTAGVDFLSLLAAALAGVGGVLLLLPVNPEALLHSPAATAATLIVVCGLCVGSCLVFSAIRGVSLRVGMLLVLLPNVVLQAGALAFHHRLFRLPGLGDVPGVVWQGGEMACLVYLLRTVEPVPLAARFLLVPLVGVGEGLFLVRPAFTWRMALGAGLLLFGSVRLLRESSRERDSSLSLL